MLILLLFGTGLARLVENVPELGEEEPDFDFTGEVSVWGLRQVQALSEEALLAVVHEELSAGLVVGLLGFFFLWAEML